MNGKIDAEWLRLALEDAEQVLAQAISLLEEDSRHASGVLEHEIPALYAKLNYAVNTAESGPVDIDSADHDALVAWPASMPFGKGKNTPGGDNPER